jgi:tripartite-type tricarboxylate transporter receptor subunit TctC
MCGDRSLNSEEQAMTIAVRRFFRLAAAVTAFSVLPSGGHAQVYPARPVHVVVGFAAGGPGDALARIMGQWLQERLGQPFIIENRPGASSNVATEAVVNSPPDGHTLLLVVTANAINATLFERLNFNFIRDIAPVAGISRDPNALVVNPSVPAKTFGEFVAYAKANPGEISIASPGRGTPAHVAGELLKIMAGIDLIQVPYRGAAPALTDVLGGQVQAYIGAGSGSLESVKAGRLRALAVTSDRRWQALPDVPTIGEFLNGYEASTWFGIGAPKNTPVEIVDKLNKEINAGLANEALKARISDLGGTVLPGSPADFGRLIAQETEKWAKVVKASGVKSD